jgi:septation ring formation regulator EzrA
MSWEKRVIEELDELRKRWREAKRRLLSEAAGKAVDAEEFVEIIDMLFIEAESELEAFEHALACGDTVNADIAAMRVNEALNLLRAYVPRAAGA